MAKRIKIHLSQIWQKSIKHSTNCKKKFPKSYPTFLYFVQKLTSRSLQNIPNGCHRPVHHQHTSWPSHNVHTMSAQFATIKKHFLQGIKLPCHHPTYVTMRMITTHNKEHQIEQMWTLPFFFLSSFFKIEQNVWDTVSAVVASAQFIIKKRT